VITAFAAHRLDRYMEITMFDRLVESSRQKQGRHTGRYLIVTSLLYGIALVTFSSLAVIGFTPALAEQLFLTTKFTPPVIPSAAQAPRRPKNPTINHRIFTPPKHLPDTLLREVNLNDNYRLPNFSGPGLSPGPLIVLPNYGATADPSPPAPLATPKPTPKIEPVPEAKHGPSKISEGVLQGIAIKKVWPVYPAIAKQVKARGMVQVQVTIAEDGRVMEADIISGPPLLRSAALEAARQWLFSPTTLSKVPVKVQGILTFNFVLE
jgi:TonB family protein